MDAILIDIVDERYGVVPTSEGFVTNSYELRNSKWKSYISTGPTVEFGTTGHLELWKAAADKLILELDNLSLLGKSFYVDSKYALSSRQGDDMDDHAFPASWRNQQFEPYFEYLRSSPLYGLNIPDEVTLADREHTWGLEAFHYIPEFYESMASQLEAGIDRTKGRGITPID